MFRRSIFALFLAGTALSGLVLFATVESRAAPACQLSVSKPWSAGRGRDYIVDAFSHGPNCQKAVVGLVIRARNQDVAYSTLSAAEHIMVFAGVQTPKQMHKALGEWLFQSHIFKSTADFPVWRKGAESPTAGEFPFYPETDMDRETYERVRSERLPVYCYVQGMESMACLALDKNGSFTKVGVQSFPG